MCSDNKSGNWWNRLLRIMPCDALLVVFALQPLLFLLVLPLQPTFDDWTYLTSPQRGTFDISLFLPNTYWRPFDALLGYTLGVCPTLFPTLNHVIILLLHLANTLLTACIARRLGFSRRATDVATLFFYLSPGILGTVLDIDSMNQAAALMWGLVAVYISLGTRRHRSLWMCVALLLSTLSKENGLTFIVIIPLLLYAFRRRSGRQIMAETTPLLAVGIAYLIVRLSLPHPHTDIGTTADVYLQGGMMQRLRNMGMYLGFSWVPVDFVGLLHAPSRNMALIVATLAMGLPLLVITAWRSGRHLMDREVVALLLCSLTTVSIHLVTIFTVMHTYAGLPFIALIMGYLHRYAGKGKLYTLAFLFWMACAMVIGLRHLAKANESGRTGVSMAHEVMAQSTRKSHRVLVVTVDDPSPHYSMFCVRPCDAFGWGLAVRHHTDYQWPDSIGNTFISADRTVQIDSITHDALSHGYDAVWIVEKDHVDVKEQGE
ncbi:MAG: hypothetical protein IKT00_09955 [Prevotella sp.]|nr:hypothetical protein [Prevotella sp.]